MAEPSSKIEKGPPQGGDPGPPADPRPRADAYTRPRAKMPSAHPGLRVKAALRPVVPTSRKRGAGWLAAFDAVRDSFIRVIPATGDIHA